MKVLLSATLLCFVISCYAKQDGAPSSACFSLMPNHSGIRAQGSSPPYEVFAEKSGNKIQVKISSPSGEEFEGFVLQARSSTDPNKFIDGEFTGSQVSKVTDCFEGKKNTLTHISPTPKREVITEWTPKKAVNENIIFRATIAKTFAIFWTEVDSSAIKLNDGSKTPVEKDSSSMYDGCFVNEGCFGLPSNCVERADCEVLLTYSGSQDGILFGIHGYLDSSMYMAMALSKDAFMGEDSVTECIRDGTNVKARESWNAGRSNTNTRELPTDSYSGSFTNGLTSCIWTTPYLSESHGQTYDLANENYYLLLAKGEVSNGRLRFHSEMLSSSEAVNFTSFEVIEGEGVSDSVKVHGTFMITAWVGFVSVAILLARHFKNTWEDSTLGGVKIWFALHRAFMITGMGFVVVALIVIFVHKKGWNSATSNPHAILGCIATGLGLINPIMAAFRPAPDHPNRPIFNWLHWGVGNLAHTIAFVTIFFAVSLPSSGLDKSFYWVMSIFIVVYLIFHFMYQVNTWSSKKNNEFNLNEMSGIRENNARNRQIFKEKKILDNVYHMLLLGIYVVFLLVTLMIFYALIGTA